ncbi:MAG: type II toxin-antitoxin system VapC family toxin [Planctomycetaceae bacterium]|nr:type II toxin-antitoxin system VapC family toxin [Planctomycetaceae bacterium]MBV8312245.1 type II toxin-antitoxin system VapC family toxin [Planctomycetaceae bacterium]
MRRIFVDTLYWIAITHRKDQWHQAAVQASRTLGGCHLVTTEEVLTEVLNAFSEAGRVLRQEAVDLVRDLHADPSVTIHPQSNQTFLSGFSLYQARPDKGYSLTDCISMEAMRQEGTSEILTHDNHFTQEGFTILL